MARPHTLSPDQVLDVLGVLCVRLGYCLPPTEIEDIAASPPTNPWDFSQLVMDVEGVDIHDEGAFVPVFEIVLAAFQGTAESAGAR